jgi:biopolymer transport protein ExbD
MSEGVKEENQLYDEINITPMLDLAYVLLVIFIIMTTASVQGVKVDTPQTLNAAPLAKPQIGQLRLLVMAACIWMLTQWIWRV